MALGLVFTSEPILVERLSDRITVFQNNISIQNEVKLALKEAKLLHEYSIFSVFSLFFYPLIIMPKKINIIFLKIINKINGLFRKIVMMMKDKNIIVLFNLPPQKYT